MISSRPVDRTRPPARQQFTVAAHVRQAITSRDAFDSAGPQGKGDQLDYKLAWPIPTTLDVIDPNTKVRSTRAAAGQTVTVLALYIDGATPGIVALDISTTPIHIQ